MSFMDYQYSKALDIINEQREKIVALTVEVREYRRSSCLPKDRLDVVEIDGEEIPVHPRVRTTMDSMMRELVGLRKATK